VVERFPHVSSCSPFEVLRQLCRVTTDIPYQLKRKLFFGPVPVDSIPSVVLSNPYHTAFGINIDRAYPVTGMLGRKESSVCCHLSHLQRSIPRKRPQPAKAQIKRRWAMSVSLFRAWTRAASLSSNPSLQSPARCVLIVCISCLLK
jgi:hypothetical protein